MAEVVTSAVSAVEVWFASFAKTVMAPINQQALQQKALDKKAADSSFMLESAQKNILRTERFVYERVAPALCAISELLGAPEEEYNERVARLAQVQTSAGPLTAELLISRICSALATHKKWSEGVSAEVAERRPKGAPAAEEVDDSNPFAAF